MHDPLKEEERVPPATPRARARRPRGGRLGLYLELGKARLSLLVVATTAVGYVLASRGDLSWRGLLLTVLGTALTSSGSLAMNQYMERTRDARMERTRHRPLPAGTITPAQALRVSVASMLAGLCILAAFANLLTAALALTVVVTYLAFYTPMKPRTPLCTLVGAVCGAIPPMMGWTAAAGRLEIGAWILAAVLFLWQIPHFLALAWLYREDYERGGFRMLPVLDRTGAVTGRMVVLYSLALLPIGLAATLAGMAGWVFLAGSVVLGMGLLALGVRLARLRTDRSARMLFFASLVYLPVMLALLVADRGPAPGARGPMVADVAAAPRAETGSLPADVPEAR
jgi:protoheme IX farnesyltransferase